MSDEYLREVVKRFPHYKKRQWLGGSKGSTNVLCIHGRPGDSSLMRPFQEWCLQNSYGCYLYNQFSYKEDAEFCPGSEELLSLLVEELWFHLCQLRDEHLVIVAHSFGAVLLCEVLQRYDLAQDRVKVVLSGFCPERKEFLTVNQQRLDDFAMQAGPAGADELFFDSHICNKSSLAEDQVVAIKRPPLGDITLRESYLELLGKLRCPVLVTYGDNDICTDYQVEKIRSRLVNCRVVKVTGAAHFPFIEQPREYFQALDRFLM